MNGPIDHVKPVQFSEFEPLDGTKAEPLNDHSDSIEPPPKPPLISTPKNLSPLLPRGITSLYPSTTL